MSCSGCPALFSSPRMSCSSCMTQTATEIYKRQRCGRLDEAAAHPSENPLALQGSKVPVGFLPSSHVIIERMRRMRAIAGVLVAYLAWIGGVGAFEYRGFRSGMSIEEATRNIPENSTMFSKGTEGIGIKVYNIWLKSNFSEVKEGNKSGPQGILYFCNRKLYRVTLIEDGGLEAFTKNLDRLLDLYGQPTVGSANRNGLPD